MDLITRYNWLSLCVIDLEHRGSFHLLGSCYDCLMMRNFDFLKRLKNN